MICPLKNLKNEKYYYQSHDGVLFLFHCHLRTRDRVGGETKGNGVSDIPQLFRNPRYTDVTDRYVETSNITVRIQNTKWLHDVKWVYLAVFDNREWAPVAFSHIDNNANASFEKLGRGVVYILLQQYTTVRPCMVRIHSRSWHYAVGSGAVYADVPFGHIDDYSCTCVWYT